MSHTDSESKAKDAVYLERNILALAFIRYHAEVEDMHGHFEQFGWWPDTDDVNGEEWAVVWTWTPHGQVGWHIDRDMVPEWLPKKDPEYDGYTTDEKNERMLDLIY